MHRRQRHIFYLLWNQSVNIKPQCIESKHMFKKTTLTTLGLSLLAVSLAACSAPTSSQTSTAPAQSAVTSAAVSSGVFSGRSDHITTGKVSVVKTAAGYQLNFASDFSLDGAPDPVVALGNGGVYTKANKLGALKNKTGGQTYTLPASFTPGQFSQVYVWCEKFDVPLGIADLSN